MQIQERYITEKPFILNPDDIFTYYVCRILLRTRKQKKTKEKKPTDIQANKQMIN